MLRRRPTVIQHHNLTPQQPQRSPTKPFRDLYPSCRNFTTTTLRMVRFHFPKSGVSFSWNDLTLYFCVSQPFWSFKAKFNVTFPTECDVLLPRSSQLHLLPVYPSIKLLSKTPVGTILWAQRRPRERGSPFHCRAAGQCGVTPPHYAQVCSRTSHTCWALQLSLPPGLGAFTCPLIPLSPAPSTFAASRSKASNACATNPGQRSLQAPLGWATPPGLLSFQTVSHFVTWALRW